MNLSNINLKKFEQEIPFGKHSAEIVAIHDTEKGTYVVFKNRFGTISQIFTIEKLRPIMTHFNANSYKELLNKQVGISVIYYNIVSVKVDKIYPIQN